MTLAISRTQLPNGSFTVLPARPPMEASTFTATALSVRALTMYGQDSKHRIDKAREWLEQARPVTNEERSMQLLGLAWSKAGAKHIEMASAELLAQQRPDGGWPQLSGIESDAYATGQALVALHEAVLVEDATRRRVVAGANAQQPVSTAQGQRLSAWAGSMDFGSGHQLGRDGAGLITTKKQRSDFFGWSALEPPPL